MWKIWVKQSMRTGAYEINVKSDATIAEFKELVSKENFAPPASWILLMNAGKTLYDNKKTLQEYGVRNNDCFMMCAKANDNPF